MVIKNKDQLKEDLPTLELTISDMEQKGAKTTIDSPVVKDSIKNLILRSP